ncbi:MAG: acylneuraminate cytidylyltransferase family protein [Balneolales bacterium]
MYKRIEIIGIIPARGGSKGIPRKNIVDLGGYPLIAWSIIRAKKSKFIDRVILSSDDDEIIKIAKQFGCEVPFTRPEQFASDESSSIEVVLHALERLNFISTNQYFVLLQPTSPFRTTETIDRAIEFSIDFKYPYVISVSELDKSPYHIFIEKENNLLEPVYNMDTRYTRRQDLPTTVVSNGALYISKASYFKKIKSFKPETIRYYKMEKKESIDIDTLQDLECAREIVNRNNLRP